MSDSEKSVNSPPTYPCRKCNKKFPTPQALGGHQRAHKLPNNAGATSSPLTAAATKTPPSYSPTTNNSPWGGSSGTGLKFNLPPSLHELPLFPLALKTTAEGDAKMTNQDPDVKMTNQDPDTTLHL